METLEALAKRLNTAPTQLRAVIGRAAAQLGRGRYYAYLTRPRPQPDGGGGARPRTVVLFAEPDDALAFARQAGIWEVPQVRPIAREQALVRLLSDSAIGRFVVIEALPSVLPQPLTRATLGQIAGAVVIERAALLEALQTPFDPA